MSLFDRSIQMPGNALLPPSRGPLYPADLKDGESVLVRPPVAPSPDDSRYWLMGDAYSQHPTETHFSWKNDPGPGLPVYGMGHGIDRLPNPSIYQFQPKVRKKGLPDFWEAHGLLVVSTRLLDILLEVDADALVHKPIVMKNLQGEVFDEHHHFVDVIRNIDAVDFANSFIIYEGGGHFREGTRYQPRAASFPSVRLLSDIDPSFHIFRHQKCAVMISDALKRQIGSVKPKFRNLAFRPVASGF